MYIYILYVYFKNTSYLLVKIADKFLSRNSQNYVTVRNMDSTPEPPSPNMAAAAPAKRKFRKCTNCTSRMPSFSYDNHTLCTKCRNQVCDMELVCDECRDWPPQKRRVFVNYNNSLRINLLSVTDGISRLPLSTLNCDQRLLPFVDFNSF